MSSTLLPVERRLSYEYALDNYLDPFLEPDEITPHDRERVHFVATGQTPRRAARRLLVDQPDELPGLNGGRSRLVYSRREQFSRLIAPKLVLPPTKRLVPVEPEFPLDTIAKNASGFVADRAARVRWRFTLQSAAGEILPGERVHNCLRARTGSEGVDVWHIPATGTGKFSGLQTCGSVWMCPVCAARISEFRKRDMERMVLAWRQRGGRVVMVTYTIPHQLEPLKDVLKRLSACRRRSVSGRSASDVRALAGSVGSVRSVEITYGASGWHPHVHELHFVSGSCDISRFGRDLWANWRDASAKLGFAAPSRSAFSVDDCDSAVSEYLAKMGREPSWNESCELVKHVSKIGTSSTRLTPMQLLAAHTMGDPFAGQIWAEYAVTMKGSHQLRTSNGLRQLLGVEKELTDQEIVEQTEQQAVHLAHLTVEEWRAVVANDCRGEILQLAAAGDAVRIRGLVDDLAEMAASVQTARDAITRRSGRLLHGVSSLG